MTTPRLRGPQATRRRRILALATNWPTSCSRCGLPVQITDDWDADHLVSLSENGPDTLANLGVAHTSCNRRHGMALAKSRTKRLRST